MSEDIPRTGLKDMGASTFVSMRNSRDSQDFRGDFGRH